MSEMNLKLGALQFDLRQTSFLVVVVAVITLGGCHRDDLTPIDTKPVDPVTAINADFAITWPPSELDLRLGKSTSGSAATQGITPLLYGNVRHEFLEPDSVALWVEIVRPDDTASRLRWNKTLAFPEYDWMSKVRVWDSDHDWLWPNLPYLLTAHGTERVDRYGGVDPGKGVDNDFAGVVIRPHDSDVVPGTWPLLSTQWHADGSLTSNGHTDDLTAVVHRSHSDRFAVKVTEADQTTRFGVWVIYADFLDASLPREWPAEPEYDGGILAYCVVSIEGTELSVLATVPPTSTGVDWEAWRLKKRLTVSGD